VSPTSSPQRTAREARMKIVTCDVCKKEATRSDFVTYTYDGRSYDLCQGCGVRLFELLLKELGAA